MKPPKYQTSRRTKRPRKPATPITPDMVDGKEPMRSFSDLKQFYELKKDEPEEPQQGPS